MEKEKYVTALLVVLGAILISQCFPSKPVPAVLTKPASPVAADSVVVPVADSLPGLIDERRVSRLFHFPICGSTAMKSEVVRVLGKPDLDKGNELVYLIPAEYPGKIRAVHFAMREGKQVQKITFLDRDGKGI